MTTKENKLSTGRRNMKHMNETNENDSSTNAKTFKDKHVVSVDKTLSSKTPSFKAPSSKAPSFKASSSTSNPKKKEKSIKNSSQSQLEYSASEEKSKTKAQKNSDDLFRTGIKRKMTSESEVCTNDAKRTKTKVAKDDKHSEKLKQRSQDVQSTTLTDAKRKERKLKKMKKKQKLKIGSEEISVQEGKAQTEALRYLMRWKTDRSSWSFQKVRQVWLLQNIFDPIKIPDADFEVLLEYLEGLRGMARQATIEKSEKLLREADDDKETSEQETKDAISANLTDEQCDRIRRLLQMLS